MRRSLRWTFNGAAMLSLVLCVATLALWGHGHWWCDSFDFNEQGSYGVDAKKGRIVLTRSGGVVTDAPGFHSHRIENPSPAYRCFWLAPVVQV